MKFKATDFRAIAYGVSAICVAVAELHRTGLLDKVADGSKKVTNKLKRNEKSKIKTEINPVIQQAAETVYYAECFRHGGYKN